MMTDISVYCLYKGKAHLSGLIISIKATVVSTLYISIQSDIFHIYFIGGLLGIKVMTRD